MSVRFKHNESNALYYCTFTCCDWLNLFEITNSYDLVYNWFDIARKMGYRICAFVIMPNHVHFITATPAREVSLNKLVSNGKRFMAYEIVDRLHKAGRADILKKLSDAVTASDRRKGKLHQVFEPSFDARIILDERMLIQKLNYIHHNPVSRKWSLAEDFLKYPHSSALFYETGKQGIYPVDDVRDILYGETSVVKKSES